MRRPTRRKIVFNSIFLCPHEPPTHTQQSLGGGRTQPGRTQPPLYLVSLENITKVMSGEFNFLRFSFINAFYCKKKKKKCRLFYNWCFQIPICSSKLHKEVLHSIASSCQTQGKLLFYSDAGSIHTQMLLKHMSDLVTGRLSLQLAKQVTISAKQEQLPRNGDMDKADNDHGLRSPPSAPVTPGEKGRCESPAES